MDAVTVGRLAMECAVPHDHRDPSAVKVRLADASDRLAAALGELLAPLSKLGDEVILIRKLELSFELDTSLPPAELARMWAARIASGVAAWLRPEARTSMVRFPDQAHYLARFLVDTASGHAAQAWYYKRWQGLAALSAAAQLRTALIEEPQHGMAALATLTSLELAAVLTALGPREARRVGEAVLATNARGEELEAVALALAPLLPTWLPTMTSLASAWQAGLMLVARALAARSLPDVHVRTALELAVSVAAVARGAGNASPAPTTIFDDAGSPSFAPLLALTSDTRSALLAPLGTDAVHPVAAPASWYTRLGGLLLLLPRIAELPLGELFGPDAGLARLAVLSRAAGSEQRDEVLTDPLWKRLCGVDPDADVDAWLPSAERLAAAMWQRGAASAQSLSAIATRHDRSLLVIAAEPAGEWLAIAPLSGELRGALRVSPVLDVDGLELAANIGLATGHAAANALAWLDPDLASPTEVALTLAAQHVLRAFARRLPGFADSSPRFLYDSFLDFDATIVDSEDTFHCRVGRPRLAALFGLTGALRGRLVIGDGRTLELYPA
ncbi:MAG: hypothetical protein ABJE66_04575 [Deltaproteobacteria bacterium]